METLCEFVHSRFVEYLVLNYYYYVVFLLKYRVLDSHVT
jgi:hypothetical protein